MAQTRTGALRVLAICFVGSALLRGPVVLAALPALGADLAEAVEAGQARIDPEIIEGSALHRELERQRAELDERAHALEMREKALAEVEARMETRLAELQAARDALAAKVAEARAAAAEDVRQLALVYERMKPKEAGRLFDAMAPSFAAGFLGEMKSQAAAAILAGMSPDRAYAVSLILAGRNLSNGEAATAAASRERQKREGRP